MSARDSRFCIYDGLFFCFRFLQAMRAQFARLRTDLVPAAAGGTTLPVARIGPPAAGHVRLLRGPGKGGDA